MRLCFGTQVMYLALDGNVYPAVVLRKYEEGDYQIAYERLLGEIAFTHCWESELTRKQSTVLDLLEKERTRARDIAYTSMEKHDNKYNAQKHAGNDLAFIEERLADECRIIRNAISGGDALSITLGETMRDRLEKEYFASIPEQ